MKVRSRFLRRFSLGVCGAVIGTLGIATASAQSTLDEVGEGPRLGPMAERMTQGEVASGSLTLRELRRAGLKIFSSPFNQHDGYGEGEINPADPTGFGGRPTLQGNGTFLRVNGLDAQTCLECHSVISNASSPPTLGVGGSGTTATVAMFMTKNIDPDDSEGNGEAFFDGRLIVPPALFGTGGVMTVGKEMTADLQKLKADAIANPGATIDLETKGVHFGSIVADATGRVDTRDVEGVDEDLVIRPFGRKGEFATVRQFDQGAMQFHFGMQPVEIVGPDTDTDNDGVMNEILPGELSVLEIFITTQERPVQDPLNAVSSMGFARFINTGCADCHRPNLMTESRFATYSFPEVDTDPTANIYFEHNLRRRPTRFAAAPTGGVIVPLFSDLKRHDMGDGLAETFQGGTEEQNREFITAKLWGVADSAPYLHDGRAQTIFEAISLHGGEAESQRDAFMALSEEDQTAIVAFLRTLRAPLQPNRDVISRAARRPGERLDQ